MIFAKLPSAYLICKVYRFIGDHAVDHADHGDHAVDQRTVPRVNISICLSCKSSNVHNKKYYHIIYDVALRHSFPEIFYLLFVHP